MSEKIVQLNEEVIKGKIKELVRSSVEETLNELLEKEAESLTQAARCERSEAHQGCPAAAMTGTLPPPPARHYAPHAACPCKFNGNNKAASDALEFYKMSDANIVISTEQRNCFKCVEAFEKSTPF